MISTRIGSGLMFRDGWRDLGLLMNGQDTLGICILGCMRVMGFGREGYVDWMGWVFTDFVEKGERWAFFSSFCVCVCVWIGVLVIIFLATSYGKVTILCFFTRSTLDSTYIQWSFCNLTLLFPGFCSIAPASNLPPYISPIFAFTSET